MEPGVLVEALSRGLPGDRIVVDPDVLGALSLDPLGIFNPGKGLGGRSACCT